MYSATFDYYSLLNGPISTVIIYRRKRDFMPSIMQNHNNGISRRPLERIVGSSLLLSLSLVRYRRDPGGRESHQLQLEINRRQMQRSPAGLVATGDRFLTPRNPPRTIRCFLQIQNDTRARWISEFVLVPSYDAFVARADWHRRY